MSNLGKLLGPRVLRDGQTVQIRWTNLVAFVVLHGLCLLAPWHFSWGALGMTAVLAWLIGGLGITLCYHRLLTHRSFQTPKWLEYFLTLLGTLAWQGSPLTWVGTHRLHHAASDGPEDPHSPQDGFGWAHIFWMVYSDHPAGDPRKAALDLQRDPVMAWLDRWWYVPQFVLAAALWAVGGWGWVIWGICVRTVVMYHATWFVNSAAHTWGYRNFETTDGSRNNWWVALFSFGEGWHNNHHAQQRSAAHGMRWFELDLTYLTIRLMEKAGLAWKVVRPKRPERQAPVGLTFEAMEAGRGAGG